MNDFCVIPLLSPNNPFFFQSAKHSSSWIRAQSHSSDVNSLKSLQSSLSSRSGIYFRHIRLTIISVIEFRGNVDVCECQSNDRTSSTSQHQVPLQPRPSLQIPRIPQWWSLYSRISLSPFNWACLWWTGALFFSWLQTSDDRWVFTYVRHWVLPIDWQLRCISLNVALDAATLSFNLLSTLFLCYLEKLLR